MTSPTSAPSSKSGAASSRSGFTLVEMLVVIGIMVLLAGIALPMLLRSYRAAAKTRSAMDMQSITGALEAYKLQFGDYPRPDAPGVGYLILGRALLGPDAATAAMPTPYDAAKELPGVITAGLVHISPRVTSSPPTPAPGPNWKANPFNGDGADGFGFRARRGGGQVYGPYLDPGKFSNKNGVLLDPDGQPYLYYVASPKKLAYDGSAANVFYAGVSGAAGTGPYAHWEFTQNVATDSSGSAMPVANFRALLGDANANGYLEASETARVDGPFFLWSAGADGNFGPRGTDKVSLQDCDDILSNSSGK